MGYRRVGGRAIKENPEAAEMIERQMGILINHHIRTLVEAGFVHESESRFKVDSLVDKLKPVLNISLAELASKPADAFWVRPIFRSRNAHETKHDVFVLMPFADVLTPVYEDHIKNVCSKLELSVARADDFFNTNSIMEDIWTAIAGSRIAIADCTHRNPNVFYEMGIAHTIGKPLVLITQTMDDVFFRLAN